MSKPTIAVAMSGGVDSSTGAAMLRAEGHPVVGLITEWEDATGAVETRTEASDMGGTMRLGAQDCLLEAGSLVHDCYAKDVIVERHRHRYEVNNNLLPSLIEAGLKISRHLPDVELGSFLRRVHEDVEFVAIAVRRDGDKAFGSRAIDV